MNIQIISEILASEDNDAILKKIFMDVSLQGLSSEEAHFILSHQKNTIVCQILSVLAYQYSGDFKKSIQLLDELVLRDEALSMVLRADMYINGRGTIENKPDYEQAISLLERTIEQGNIEAMLLRADMYIYGRGIINNKPDYEQAISLLERAIEQGSSEALVKLSFIYREGLNTTKNEHDYKQTISLLERAITQGSTKAMVELAFMYRKGFGTTTNQPEYKQAISLLERAIEQGNTEAMVRRAALFRDGLGTPRNEPDYEQAISLLERAIAQGNTEAMLLHADMLINGCGIIPDQSTYSKALALIIKALHLNPWHPCDPCSRIKDVQYLLSEMAKQMHVDSEYFLFINLYKPDGYFPHNKAAALDLFQKHPIQHFATFCQGCIDAIITQELTEEMHQIQIERINELRALIPNNKNTPAVQAAINRFIAYGALFISKDPSISYEHFRKVPEEHLSADDFIEITHMILAQGNIDHQDTEFALELSQHAQEKAPDDDEIRRLNSIVSKLYLKKNLFTKRSETTSAKEALQLHAQIPRLNRATQQINLLKEYQGYLLSKDKFETREGPVDELTKDLVATLINDIDMGSKLEDLLILPDIKKARKNNASFNNLINQLMQLPFLPAQNLQPSYK